ncbi:type VI secretion system baseplate subunit TssE [Janthinobacterium sp. 1_2014MBL_MicDiv]|uniref:type VI secretion system baseplate subunit TssE n=1 Tax=Janthinobacterium sp. 1_2014MBL_MicDiv TaxID=1644131 RepID=UPI0008F542A2|nr:type VI secretion system baseplate subunit TssE [Janthinobacterium sp. 1_2014MBL_MicDiv]APA68735.1 type VI secretion protein, lysozyme-like protein [Janthinobacterium sp. 1_2014MBL_MicDiv]
MHATPAGSLVPLFDRLGGEPDASADGRVLDVDGLRHSLQLDLARLFNVRNGMSIAQFLGDAPTVLDYGLPDTLALSPQSAADLALWQQVLAHAIALYEPRLSRVSVRVAPDAGKPTAARVAIAATAMLGRQLCQVQFDVVLDDRAAQGATRCA